MHVLVVTCVHRGDDARIVHRQARSLLDAGHRVTLVAPTPPQASADPAGLERIGLTRAAGRRRLRAWREARRALRANAAAADLVLLHDPELLPVAMSARVGRPLIWDVHEDYVASAGERAYIPAVARPLIARLVAQVERSARRRCHVVLAEESYATRFGDAPVVPNSAWVPTEPAPRAASADRVVYVGRISAGRGVHEMIEVGRRIAGCAELVMIGPADADVERLVRQAHDQGWLRWLGPLANPLAMEEVDGAVCGLSLLRDQPNYVQSRPTKVMEYLSRGVPVVTTPLPLAADLVRTSGGGVVVPFGDVTAVIDAIDDLRDPASGVAAGRRGHDHVARHHNWHADGRRFVELLERWATDAR